MSGAANPTNGPQATAEQVMQEFAAMRRELMRHRDENQCLKSEQAAALEQVRQESTAPVAEIQAQIQQVVQ